MSEIRDRVIEMIYEACRPERPDLSDTTRPLLNSGLDSLHFATLLMALEDGFKITVGEEDLEHLKSIDDIVSYLGKSAANRG